MPPSEGVINLVESRNRGLGPQNMRMLLLLYGRADSIVSLEEDHNFLHFLDQLPDLPSKEQLSMIEDEIYPFEYNGDKLSLALYKKTIGSLRRGESLEYEVTHAEIFLRAMVTPIMRLELEGLPNWRGLSLEELNNDVFPFFYEQYDKLIPKIESAIVNRDVTALARIFRSLEYSRIQVGYYQRFYKFLIETLQLEKKTAIRAARDMMADFQKLVLNSIMLSRTPLYSKVSNQLFDTYSLGRWAKRFDTYANTPEDIRDEIVEEIP